MRKFESSQKDESRVQLADFSKRTESLEILIVYSSGSQPGTWVHRRIVVVSWPSYV